jgi:hypothetical protein
MSKETSNAREGDSTEGCRQGVGRDPAHPDAGVGGNPSGLSTPIAAGGGEDADAAEDARLHPNAPDKPSSSDLVERLRANLRMYSGWACLKDIGEGPEIRKGLLDADAALQRLEAERAEAYEKGRESAFEEIGNYYLMRKDCQDALAKAQATITALQSELEISHARYLNYDELATAEIKSLQSERDRLRGVLTEISNSAFGDDATNELSMEGCISLARRALAGKD